MPKFIEAELIEINFTHFVNIRLCEEIILLMLQGYPYSGNFLRKKTKTMLILIKIIMIREQCLKEINVWGRE